VDLILALSVPTTSTTSTIDLFRWIFFTVYSVEIVLKITALGPTTFLCKERSKINAIDTTLICSVVVLFSLDLTNVIEADSPFYTGLLKVRYFRLITHVMTAMSWFMTRRSHKHTFSKSMQKITNVVSRSLASMYNIFEVWFVLTLIWSAVGVAMFAQSADNNNNNNNNNNNQIHFSQHLYGLNDHSNFNDFFHSFLSLLRISTYDHWSELYKGCLELHGGSSGSSSGLHAVYTFLTALYFVSYIIITGPLLKALSVAVLYVVVVVVVVRCCSLLFVVVRCCLLLFVRCSLFVRCLLLFVRCLLLFVRCSFVARSLLVRCSFVVRSMKHVLFIFYVLWYLILVRSCLLLAHDLLLFCRYSQFVRLKSMNESKTMLSTRDKEAFTSVWLQ
jgi:hypothetical protein